MQIGHKKWTDNQGGIEGKGISLCPPTRYSECKIEIEKERDLLGKTKNMSCLKSPRGPTTRRYLSSGTTRQKVWKRSLGTNKRHFLRDLPGENTNPTRQPAENCLFERGAKQSSSWGDRRGG